jgi:hypothetical protein
LCSAQLQASRSTFSPARRRESSGGIPARQTDRVDLGNRLLQRSRDRREVGIVVGTVGRKAMIERNKVLPIGSSAIL